MFDGMKSSRFVFVSSRWMMFDGFVEALDEIIAKGVDPFKDYESSVKKIQKIMSKVIKFDSKVWTEQVTDTAIWIMQIRRLIKECGQDPEYTSRYNKRLDALKSCVESNGGNIRKVLSSPYAEATDVRYIITEHRNDPVYSKYSVDKYLVAGHFYMMNPFADISHLDMPAE